MKDQAQTETIMKAEFEKLQAETEAALAQLKLELENKRVMRILMNAFGAVLGLAIVFCCQPSEARIDFDCNYQCMSKGENGCAARCTVPDEPVSRAASFQQYVPAQPALPAGYDPSLFKQTDWKCENDCIDDGHMIGFCKQKCSF
jgi:hypothetical protein